MERKQLSNVLAVAAETESIEVLKNFIYYQIGRPGQEGWKSGGFGSKLVAKLDGLRTIAGEIAAAGGGDAEELWIELARQYLGHLQRWFVYKKET